MKTITDNLLTNNKILINYIRDKNGHPYGVIAVSKNIDNSIRYGYSLCNNKEGDRFSKKRGKMIAIGRLKSNKWQQEIDITDVPHAINRHLDDMIDRGRRYFQLTN